MPYVRDSFWRGREFTSLAQMQAEAARWSAEVAGQRPCRPLDGAAPAAVFAAVEKDALRPLPAEPFVLATWAKAQDRPRHPRPGRRRCCTRCRGGTSARPPTCASPPRWCSSSSAGSWSRPTRARTGASRPTSRDYPPEKIAFHMRTPAWCRKQAAGIGPACEQVISELLADNALYRLRAAQGVIGPGRPQRPRPAGSRLREGPDRRGSLLPDHQGHPGRRHRARDTARSRRGRRGRGVPARPGLVRQHHPDARHRHQRRRAPRQRTGGHIMTAGRTSVTASGTGPADLAGRPRPRDPRRRGPARAGPHRGPVGVARARRDRDPGPRDLPATCRSRAAAVARLAALTGCEPAPDPRPGRTQGWIHARGQFAGHPVHIYTPVKEQPPS